MTGYYDHPRLCDPGCRARAVPTPYERDRPPMRPCPHCHAPAGVACASVGRIPRRLAMFGRVHPSRLEVAA